MQEHRKNILFINHSIKHGGPSKSLFYILKHLDRSRLNPFVLIPADDIFSDDLRKEGLYENIIVDKRFPDNLMRPRVGFEWKRGTQNPKFAFYISIIINVLDLISLVITSPFMMRKHKIDLIYCNGTVAKIVGALIGLINWRPVIWHVRNIQLKTPMIYTINILSLLPVIKKIICVSKPTADQFKYAFHKTAVINNGLDMDDFNSKKIIAQLRKEYGINEQTVLIGTIGRVVVRKKYEILFDIANRLKSTVPKYYSRLKFVIVGNTPYYFRVDQLEELKIMAIEKGMEDHFVFTGYKDDIRPYLKDFDIFVLTSDYPDPFPRSVIEAMALSKPVVGFRIGGITESVDDEKSGILCKPGDIEEMTEAIISLIKSKTKRKSMGKEGRNRIEALYQAKDRSYDIEKEILNILN